jgi:hypothetical protein
VSGGLPGWLLQHTITIEPYEGTGAYGHVYGPPTAVRCFVDEQTRTVRSAAGDQTTSSGTAYAALDTVAPPLSRVVLPTGRTTVVIQALRRDGGTLPVPSHLEIQLE